jgi:hemerythrin
MLQEITAALAAGDWAHARALTANLLALAEDHRAREEAFLRRIGFPEVEMLIAAQQDSLSRIATLKDATPGEASDLIASMEDALVAYLLGADINYKSFVEAAGRSTGWHEALGWLLAERCFSKARPATALAVCRSVPRGLDVNRIRSDRISSSSMLASHRLRRRFR